MRALLLAATAATLAFAPANAQSLTSFFRGANLDSLAQSPTETGFSSQAGADQSRLFKGPTMDARTVAEAGYAALMAGKPVVIPGVRNRILAFSVRLAPRRVVTQMVRRMQEE